MWGARCDWGGAGGWETVWTESAACPGLEAACPPLALLGPHHQRPESLPLLLSALPEVVRLPTCQWQLFLFRQGPDRAVYARGIQKSTGLKTTTPESLNWWFLLLTSISLFVINHIMITIIILIIIGTSKPLADLVNPMQWLRYSSSLLPVEELSLFKKERRQPTESIRSECQHVWIFDIWQFCTRLIAAFLLLTNKHSGIRFNLNTRTKETPREKKVFSFRLLALFHQLCFWSFSSQMQISWTLNCFLGWIFIFPSTHPIFLNAT